MQSTFNDLVNLGARPGEFDEHNRIIMNTNATYLALPVVYLIFMVIDLRTYLKPVNQLQWDQFIVPVMILVCFLGLYLNKLGHSLIGALLFLFLWPLLMHHIPIIFLNTPVDYYLAYPLAIIFHSLLIHLMLSKTKRPLLFWFMLTLNFMMMYFMTDFLVAFDVASSNDVIEVVSDRYFVVDGILYWLLFNLLVFFLLRVNARLIEDLNRAKRLIEFQKKELTDSNEQLEEKVIHRTREVALQNDKLKSYAIYNAHDLRGNFVRVKGLFELRKMEGAEKFSNEINLKIDQSLKDLDATILKIQEVIE